MKARAILRLTHGLLLPRLLSGRLQHEMEVR